jgi:hypothetical protein
MAGWGGEAETDPNVRYREARLRRVRNYIKAHLHLARRIVDRDKDRLTQKKFFKLPFLICTGPDNKLEYVLSVDAFSREVCSSMPWRHVLETLATEGYLNPGPSDLLTCRNLPKPLVRTLVVSIKPKILRYRTDAEKAADRDLMVETVRRVRDYIKRHEKDALLYRTNTDADRVTRRQLSEARLLAHVRDQKLHAFVLSEEVFREEVCGTEPPELVLQRLRSAGYLNEGKDGDLYVQGKFAKPLGKVRVVSIKPSIRKYWTDEDEGELARKKEQQERRRLARLERRRFGSGGIPSGYRTVPLTSWLDAGDTIGSRGSGAGE